MATPTVLFPQQLQNKVYDSLFRWILLMAAITFGAVILWDYGFLNYLFANDISRVSMLIIAIFLGTSLYCLYVLLDFSQELRAAEEVTTELERGARLRPGDDALAVGDSSVTTRRLVGEFLQDVTIKRRGDSEANVETLMQSFASRLRIPGRRGLFVSDSMYKLGMLGTVIGFIAMLVSMRELGDFEVEAMQEAMQQMTGGMAVALLTTITGLVCGLLLRLQFNILDALAMHILRRVVRLTELFVTSGPVGQGRHV